MPPLPLSSSLLNPLIDRSAASPNSSGDDNNNPLQIVCAWPVSGQYGPGTRVLLVPLLHRCEHPEHNKLSAHCPTLLVLVLGTTFSSQLASLLAKRNGSGTPAWPPCYFSRPSLPSMASPLRHCTSTVGSPFWILVLRMHAQKLTIPKF